MEASNHRRMEVMAAPRKYPDELRERAIRFALDLVEAPEKLSVNAACKRVGEQLGIVPDSLRNWVQQTRIDDGNAPGPTTDEPARSVAPGAATRGRPPGAPLPRRAAASAPGLTTDERARLVELERENRELRRANAILKSASAFFAAELDRPSPRGSTTSTSIDRSSESSRSAARSPRRASRSLRALTT